MHHLNHVGHLNLNLLRHPKLCRPVIEGGGAEKGGVEQYVVLFCWFVGQYM